MPRALAVLLLFAAPLFAQTDVMLQHLRADYQKKALLIRGFYQDPLLRYDASGALLNQAQPGSWTTSFLDLQSIELKDGRLELHGFRAVQLFDDHKHRFQLHRVPDKILLTIDAGATPDEASLRKALAQVLVMPSEPIAPLLSDSWQWVFAHMDKDGVLPPLPKKTASAQKEACPAAPSLEDPCYVRDEVKPPKPIHTPDPAFNDFGRALRIRGQSVLQVVLDETGRPQKLRIVKPLGCGLDEAALERVSSWTFQPATRNGQPVPVKITVEINFSWH
jgi:protein TonB